MSFGNGGKNVSDMNETCRRKKENRETGDEKMDELKSRDAEKG